MNLIFDGDYPLAYGAFDLNRDPTLSLAELRAQDDSDAEAFACFPEMRRGGVAVALPPLANGPGAKNTVDVCF